MDVAAAHGRVVATALTAPTTHGARAAPGQHRAGGPANVGGTASAITLAPSPAHTAWPTGAHHLPGRGQCSGRSRTVALNALAAINITKQNGTNATTQIEASGDIVTGAVVGLIYDGTSAQIAFTAGGHRGPGKPRGRHAHRGHTCPRSRRDGTSSWAPVSSGTGFDVYVGAGTEATIADDDRIPFADVDATGEPNRYASASALRTYFGAQTAAATTDIHDLYSTELAALAADDRFIVSDESVSGDPTKWTSAATMRAYFGGGIQPARPRRNCANLVNDDDRFLMSAESIANDPNALHHGRRPAHLHAGRDRVRNSDIADAISTFAGSDRLVLMDDSVSGDPNRYITAANASQESVLRRGFDIHDHIGTSGEHRGL